MSFLPSWNGINDIVIPLPYTPPLDGRSDVACAYSFTRKLRTAYGGPIYRVLSSVTGVQTDIYFSATGQVNQSYLTALAAGGDLAVTILYDQSTNARNLTATWSSVNTLYVVKAGVVQTINSLPTCFLNNQTNQAILYNSGSAFSAFSGGFTAVYAAFGNQDFSSNIGGKVTVTNGGGCGPTTNYFDPSPFMFKGGPPQYGGGFFVDNGVANPYGMNATVQPTVALGQRTGYASYPVGVAIDSSGNIFTSTVYSQIVKYNSSGVYQSAFGSYGIGVNGKFYSITGLRLDSSGNIWVADNNQCVVYKFSSTGTLLLTLGTPNTPSSANGQFNGPADVAFDTSGNIYVADQYNHRIQKFNSSGTYITQWGTYGTSNGQFQYPVNVSVDTGGNVWVTDNNGLQKFSNTGAFISKAAIINIGGQPGWIDWNTNLVYLCSYFCVNVYNLSMVLQNTIGNASTPGSDNAHLFYPHGVTTDSSGNIYIADRYNNRIQKFNSSYTYVATYGNTFTTALNLYSFVCNSSSKAATAFYNGNANGSGTAINYADVLANPLSLGGVSGFNSAADVFTGYISEAIFLNTDLSTGNRATLESNLRSFYGTP